MSKTITAKSNFEQLFFFSFLISVSSVDNPLQAISPSREILKFQTEYQRDKSYLITRSEAALLKIKDLYYDTKVEASGERYWPWWAMLMVPIYERRGKIIGFIMVDDPADCLLPGKEETHTLEILANQVSVAIENRLTYLQLQDRAFEKTTAPPTEETRTEGGIKRLVDLFFR